MSPCVNCATRKYYARVYDINFSMDDCIFSCEKWKEFKGMKCCKCGKPITDGRVDKYCRDCRREYTQKYRHGAEKKESKLKRRESANDCTYCAFNDRKKGCTQRVCVMIGE